MNIGVLDWLNENSLISYPLDTDGGLPGFIVDANFIQFDGFLPYVKSVTVTDDSATVFIQTDKSVISVELARVDYSETVEEILRDGDRYIGRIVFGKGTTALWNDYPNQTVTKKLTFSPAVVKAIPSKCGVYTFNGLHGAVTVSADPNITFDVTGNVVRFDAVGIPDELGLVPLKTI